MFFSPKILPSNTFFNVAGFLDPSLYCDEFVLWHAKNSQLVPAKKDD